MQFGLFLFGAVPMSDAGAGLPLSTDRRTTNDVIWDTTERLAEMGVRAEEAGFDYFFLTEHHFQHEGYEVIPNALMVDLVIAERTSRIKLGALVHVLPQWHPLRFAEDFATLHNFSGGRAVLCVGRGTVPRESMPLGAVVGSTDDPVARAQQDAFNRAKFNEAIDVVQLALDEECFSFHGEHYDFPPPGIPDRGAFTTELTLTPRPVLPYEKWQTVTSPATLESVARRGFGGVWWNLHPEWLKRDWDRFGEIWEEEHGLDLPPLQMNVVQIRIEDTHEAALAAARPAHDEYWKFLAPYGRTMGYRMPDGSRAPNGWIPTLEESMEQGVCFVGTADDVGEQLAERIELLDLEYLTFFPICLGDNYDTYADQIGQYADDLMPQLL